MLRALKIPTVDVRHARPDAYMESYKGVMPTLYEDRDGLGTFQISLIAIYTRRDRLNSDATTRNPKSYA